MNASLLAYGPRERLIEAGVDALADADLIALILGTGHPSEPVEILALRMLAEQGGLDGLSRAGFGELSARRGVGAAKGARLTAAVELGRRVAVSAARTLGLRLSDPRAVEGWARPRLGGLDHEELWMLALDGQHHLKAARRVASGGLHGMFVSSRDPLRAALREGASAFVLVHNHPSGDPTPSSEDVSFTTKVFEAGRVVSTPLLDHVVVTRSQSASMLDLGLIPEGDK